MKFVSRNIGYFTVCLLVAICALIAIRGPQGIPALAEKRNEIRVLQEQNADLQKENERKRDRISRLQTSSAEQELEIRNRLKLLRKGETSFILPDQPKAAQ